MTDALSKSIKASLKTHAKIGLFQIRRESSSGKIKFVETHA
jgi:hypothetical protein